MNRAPIRTAVAARGVRLVRRGEAPAPLEALAAEFALLAQRRGRVRRQIALLDAQREAADNTLRQVEHRLALLSRRMLPEAAAPVAEVARPLAVPPPPPPPPRASLPPPPPPPVPAASPAPRPLVRGRRRMVLEY